MKNYTNITDRHGNFIAPLSSTVNRILNRNLGDVYENQILSIHKVSVPDTFPAGVSRAYKTERFKNGA